MKIVRAVVSTESRNSGADADTDANRLAASVKPRVLWRLVYLVVVVWGRGRSTTSRAVASAPVAAWWACSCSTGVSIPIAE